MQAPVNISWIEGFWLMCTLAAVLSGLATNFYTDLFSSMAMMARYGNVDKVGGWHWLGQPLFYLGVFALPKVFAARAIGLDVTLMFLSWIEAFWLSCSLCILCPGVVVVWAPNLSPLINRLLTYGKIQLIRGSDCLSLLEVPKRWFTHFYIVATLTSEVALALSLLRLTRFDMYDAKPVIILQDVLSFLRQPVGTVEMPTKAPPPRINEATVVLCCLLVFSQALRRFFESAFLSVYSDTKMNIFHYLLGITHYVMVPCSILSEGPSLTSSAIYESEASEVMHRTFLLGALKKLTLMQWFGVILFIWASFKQDECFRILSAMRRGYSGQVLTHSHGVPQGGWFEYVACPHFFFEILIYISIWLCQNLAWNTWPFVTAFVIVNQMIAASITREWYLRKFPEIYPPNRTALIPYVF